MATAFSTIGDGPPRGGGRPGLSGLEDSRLVFVTDRRTEVIQ